MEPRFKLRLSRMFQSSFASCRSRNLSDIIHKAVFLPPVHDASFRKIRPDSDQTTQTVNSSRDFDFDFDFDLLLPKRKLSHRRFPLAPFPSAISGGRTCPPASPISPPKPFSEFAAEKATNRKKTTKKKKQKKKTKQRKQSPSSSVESNFGGTWWYSSEDDDDDETETLFSSKSRSSDSSGVSSAAEASPEEIRGARESGGGVGVLPLNGGDSFAVVKKSRDPYNDFRSSMLEMIVEKQIFCVKDLEQLLQCFLSLNSHRHHRVILEVFTEIWEALFSDWWGSS